MTDKSNGYDAIAPWWTTLRTPTIGPKEVLEWAAELAPGAAILDLGCGDGFPLAVALAEAGFDVHGSDASPNMIAKFRERLPAAKVECCAAEESRFFERTFDGIMSWGLMFLLTPETQRALIARVSRALNPGGRFLFTAPRAACEWRDVGTERLSAGLGRGEYERVLRDSGLVLVGDAVDEGGNYYYLALKAGAAPD